MYIYIYLSRAQEQRVMERAGRRSSQCTTHKNYGYNFNSFVEQSFEAVYVIFVFSHLFYFIARASPDVTLAKWRQEYDETRLSAKQKENKKIKENCDEDAEDIKRAGRSLAEGQLHLDRRFFFTCLTV